MWHAVVFQVVTAWDFWKEGWVLVGDSRFPTAVFEVGLETICKREYVQEREGSEVAESTENELPAGGMFDQNELLLGSPRY